jgi:hypothetical protein
LGKQIGVGDWGEAGEEDAGWISPDNLTEYTSSFVENLDPSESPEKFKVACLTLDFAMQVLINTLLCLRCKDLP